MNIQIVEWFSSNILHKAKKGSIFGQIRGLVETLFTGLSVVGGVLYIGRRGLIQLGGLVLGSD